MRVFVTGATGFIGSEIVSELVAAGHDVSGLTRTASGAERLLKAGAKPVTGQLTDHAILQSAASKSEGVIHAAFIHGLQHMSLSNKIQFFLGMLTAGPMNSFFKILHDTEVGAVRALGAGLSNTGHPLVVTSGVLFLPPGKISTEKDEHVSDAPNRSFSEKAALDFIANGVRTSIVRLPPTVHDKGDKGFIPMIIKSAEKKRESIYIGDGSNRWPAVHRKDAATLFRLVLERGEAGAKYHGVGESGIPFREIASLIGSRLSLPVQSMSAKDAKHLSFLSNFVGVDNPSSSDWTRQTLDWQPLEIGLLADMEKNYF